MLLIFNAPMTAHRDRELSWIGERTEKIAAFGTDVIANDPGGLHPSDRLESRPIRFGIEPTDLVAEGIATNLNAAVVFLDRFQNRQVSTGDFGIEPKLDVFAQGRICLLYTSRCV